MPDRVADDGQRPSLIHHDGLTQTPDLNQRGAQP